MVFERRSKGRLSYDLAPANDKALSRELLEKAAEQSGLTENEVILICMCREYKIFKKVYVYAKILKSV